MLLPFANQGLQALAAFGEKKPNDLAAIGQQQAEELQGEKQDSFERSANEAQSAGGVSVIHCPGRNGRYLPGNGYPRPGCRVPVDRPPSTAGNACPPRAWAADTEIVS